MSHKSRSGCETYSISFHRHGQTSSFPLTLKQGCADDRRPIRSRLKISFDFRRAAEDVDQNNVGVLDTVVLEKQADCSGMF